MQREWQLRVLRPEWFKNKAAGTSARMAQA
jgi:hypothetical protein